MQRARVGSIVVVDEAARPLGIFTERDLLRHAARGGIETANPVEAYMTPAPACLSSTATAADAAMLMARIGIRHVPVVEEGRLVGVVSERDLFALQRMSLRDINHTIDAAADLPELRQAATRVRDLASNMIAQGMGAEHVTELIAVLNDKLVRRVLDLELRRHDLGGVGLCWIALGSEGRLEQTLATDQDNGIIFSGDLAEDTRERLLRFGQSVNRTLDACGFPLCRGDIMAGNPQWCLSLEEWQEKFDDWIRNPLPQALLHSSIFFDFRALWGDASLAERLRSWLIPRVKDNQRFLRAMAQSALQSRPALGVFRQITVTRAADASASVDLKAQGTRPFVDAARIYALAAGLERTNTPARLRLSGDRLGMPREEVESMVAAFHFVLLFRMRHQQLAPGKDPNRIDPESLNDIDRRILKEAFRQARTLQSRLSLDYQL
jgi:CBS domain-containing protein